MQPLLQVQRTTHYGFELGCVVRDNIVCEPGNMKWAGQGITAIVRTALHI